MNSLAKDSINSSKDILEHKVINRESFKAFGDYVRSQIANEYGVDLPETASSVFGQSSTEPNKKE
jgi:hypothetical protein